MRFLWKNIRKMVQGEEIQAKCFLLVNTVFWSACTFVLVYLLSSFFVQDGSSQILYGLIGAGYAGVFIGFIGGCIFVMRNS